MDIQDNQEAAKSIPANGIEGGAYWSSVKCSTCPNVVHTLALFPGGVCVACYERAIDRGEIKLMSAGDVSRAFGGR